VDRVISYFNNSQNYVNQAAAAITNYSATLGYDTCTDAAIANGDISLSNYKAVIWMSGRQSNVDGTFNATVQPLVTSYMNAGGKMFVSGSDIGWDLVASGHGSSFFTNTLHASFPQVSGSYSSSDNAGTHAATGNTGAIFAGISLGFSDGTGSVYNVSSPDVVGVGSGATSDMTYSGGTPSSAAIQYTSGNTQLVYMGFPFETITTSANQNSVMSAVMNYFNMSTATPSLTPPAPDLTAAKDSGTSSTDNLTNFNNSTSGKAPAFALSGLTTGASVTIFSDGTAIGSGTASGSTATITTSGALTLTEGTHTITVQQTAPGQLVSTTSPGLQITIDTTPPSISPATFNYNTGQSVTYTFGETLAASPSNGNVTITPTAGGTSVTTAASYNSGTRTVTYTFPNGTLANGNYTATFTGSSISDAAGNSPSNKVTTFYFLMGDANHNGTVDSTDFGLLAANYGKSGKNFSGGDFNYDGVTNALDFNALATNYGLIVPTSGDLPDLQNAMVPLAASRMQPVALGSSSIRDAASGSASTSNLFSDQRVATDPNLTDLIA
jgi:hypothetical protein